MKSSVEFGLIVARAKETLRDGLITEETLKCLRASGLSILESIQAVSRLVGISLGEAKEIVHFSHTWSDMRSENERLHEAAIDAVEELAKEEKER